MKDQFSVAIGGGSGDKRPEDEDLISKLGIGAITLEKSDWLANMKASEHLAKNAGSISISSYTVNGILNYIKANYPSYYTTYSLVSLSEYKDAFEIESNYHSIFFNGSCMFFLSSSSPITTGSRNGFYYIYAGDSPVYDFRIYEDGTYENYSFSSSMAFSYIVHSIFMNNELIESEPEVIFEYPEEFPERQSDEDEWTVYAPQEVPDGDTFTIGNTDSNKILETANEANAKNGSTLADLQRAIGISTGIRSSGGHTVTNVDGSTSSPDDLVETISQARIDAGLENEPSPDPSPEPDPAENENGDLGDFSLPSGLADITDKFPFCIPFDLVDCFSGLYSDTRKAPVWTADIEFPSIDYTLKFSVDMSDYDEYIEIFREGEFVVFIIGLMFATGKLINWEAAS